MQQQLTRWRKGLWHLRQGGLRQFNKWRRRSRYDYGSLPGIVLKDGNDMVNSQDYPEVQPVNRPKSFPGLRVGVILDEFSLRAWTPEFHTVLVTPNGWQNELEAEPIDLLLVESAWAGNHGAWQYQMTGSRAPRQELVNLVDHCKREAIPTALSVSMG